MSTLLYDIRLEEEYHGSNNTYRHETRNLPHFSQIKKWLPKQWDNCNIPSIFDGILKNKITACPMTVFQKPDGTAIARVHIQFIPGFRLTKNRREECFEQLDAQITDGFGERTVCCITKQQTLTHRHTKVPLVSPTAAY